MGRRRSDDIVPLPGGRFAMGTEGDEANPLDAEGPVREVAVGAFGVDRCAVTVRQFEEFVADTGYRTEAEEFGWSFVFDLFLPSTVRRRAPRVPGVPWWCAVEGATWRRPEGPGSDVDSRGDHPVVQVSWRDARAYAVWAGGRLPTETEWEYAARGGLHQARYPWGDELTPEGEHRCNIWQGTFPGHNTADDGYVGTAPVTAFAPNGYGLYNVVGNVWEMCADTWATGTTERVLRGGSYLCHASYCNRYRVAARTKTGPDSSSGNQGFRLVYDL